MATLNDSLHVISRILECMFKICRWPLAPCIAILRYLASHAAPQTRAATHYSSQPTWPHPIRPLKWFDGWSEDGSLVGRNEIRTFGARRKSLEVLRRRRRRWGRGRGRRWWRRRIGASRIFGCLVGFRFDLALVFVGGLPRLGFDVWLARDFSEIGLGDKESPYIVHRCDIAS